MSAALKALLDQVMALPEQERAELATLILRSLEPEDEPELTDDEWRTEWAAEISRRRDEVRDGSVNLVDGDQALRAIRDRASSRRP